MPASHYNGTLRAEITLIEGGARIDWLDSDRKVIWSEGSTPGAGLAFSSQIECSGEFKVKPGYFIDDAGKRHHVMQADAGKLGAVLGG